MTFSFRSGAFFKEKVIIKNRYESFRYLSPHQPFKIIFDKRALTAFSK